MFTGIVEEVGALARVRRTGQGYEMTIRAGRTLEGTQAGDSIAVNGVCLTVTRLGDRSFTVGLAPETRSRTNLAALRVGDAVNLERSLTPTSRMGGHFVQGHVDGLGTITAFRRDQDALWVTVEAAAEIMAYIVPKGFVALDGVSLTVVDVYDDRFTVTLVAYTQEHITLPEKEVGYRVNVEVDILGKYVEKQLKARFGRQEDEGITLEWLSEQGYS